MTTLPHDWLCPQIPITAMRWYKGRYTDCHLTSHFWTHPEIDPAALPNFIAYDDNDPALHNDDLHFDRDTGGYDTRLRWYPEQAPF